MSIYQLEVSTIRGEKQKMQDYAGKPLLIVNTASKCIYTSQYDGLQQLYLDYHDQGLEVLGFPCNQFSNQEPGSEGEIEQFCKINHGVTFPLFAKIDVKGPQADPLFQLLTKEAPGLFGSKNIKWNFTKFLVDRQGRILKRYAPTVKPEKIAHDIKKLL